ncbi:RNA polymerase III C34 subunit [Cryptosporidium ryanae]|uniref:RNA polymerase III C34 subunit n=1 Tax=Cryptosporidium ryanae TaxID=515981 RepID=UPI00351A6020|nr:RNA polymerase III C34 subunit [Cryptosporidium ryanae]
MDNINNTGTVAGSEGGRTNNQVQITASLLQEAYMHGCKNNNELTPDSLQSLGWDKSVIVRVLNIFTERRLCCVRRNKQVGILSSENNKVVFQLRTEDVAFKLNKLSNEEYLVFCSIEDAGNQGIWTADIRKITGLQTHQVQRAVKVLCNDWNLIRPVKSIHVKNRKVYILSSLEPSKELDGGTFYENGEFDMNLVDIIKEKIISFLESRRKCTFNEILEFINCDMSIDSSSNKKNISLSDLQTVISILISELKILCMKGSNHSSSSISTLGLNIGSITSYSSISGIHKNNQSIGNNNSLTNSGSNSNQSEVLYMPLKWPFSLSIVEEVETVPCLSCPVFSTCSWSFKSQITPCPQNCKYIDDYICGLETNSSVFQDKNTSVADDS